MHCSFVICKIKGGSTEDFQHFVEMTAKDDEVFFLNDSGICLCWIKSVDKEWKAWVENKTNAIRVLTDLGLWRSLPGGCNPLDSATRKGEFVD